MATTFDTGLPPTLESITHPATPAVGHGATADDHASVVTPNSQRVGALGLLGLRLAIGFEFLWAFLDKVFGFGWHTASGKAWIHGGSPTTGFLSGVHVGPLQGAFRAMAGVTAIDWLFMMGLLCVGVALILGVALRPAAISGGLILAMMYVASWPFAKLSEGVPTASTNPIIDDHIVSFMALVAIGAFAAMSAGALSRRWSALATVRSHSWLR
jgi:thiosulfate dehydrogenase [quinone] large subunit